MFNRFNRYQGYPVRFGSQSPCRDRSHRVIFFLLIFSYGCASQLQFDNSDVDELAGSVLCQTSKTVNTIFGTPNKTCVKATNAVSFVYFSFTDGEVSINSPSTDGNWDLGFKRYAIKTNGGTSGAQNGSVKVVAGAAGFDSATHATASGYFQDENTNAPVNCTNADNINYAFLNDVTTTACWYNYDSGTHKLSPRDQYYFVTAADGSYYKFKMLGYYSSTGTSGYMSFEWAAVTAP